MENWSAQDDSQASTLTTMIKQAANLMVFQKYFDQWDYSWKLCGERILEIMLNNWNAAKVSLMIGEEPTAYFYSRIFTNYQMTVEEGLLTPTQKNYQARQMMEINQVFGREVIPPSMIIKDMNVQGKAEIMEFLQQQEQAASQQQNDAQMVAHAIEDAKLKELYSKATANIARAREDHSRSESNLGLFEERMSMIQRNQALTLKEKQAALTSMLENIERFGDIENQYAENKMNIDQYNVRTNEELEKQDVERRTEANKFLEQILGGISAHPNGPPGQQQMQPQNRAMATPGLMR
jgi:DNA-directed RNA polymerase beta subunit